MLRSLRPWHYALAGATYVTAAGIGYALFYSPPPLPRIDEAARRSVFDTLAGGYDHEVNLHERLSGIHGLRTQLVGRARGDTLEIACGTGRNTGLYTPAVTSLTLTDFSRPMLAVAEGKCAEHGGSPPRLVVADAAALPFPDASFDTVVDTFGLCSFEDPVRVLRELKRVTRKGGDILLLEHGASDNSLLRSFLERNENAHAHKWGCYWARDLPLLLSQAGLPAPTLLTRRHLGTTMMAVVRV